MYPENARILVILVESLMCSQQEIVGCVEIKKLKKSHEGNNKEKSTGHKWCKIISEGRSASCLWVGTCEEAPEALEPNGA